MNLTGRVKKLEKTRRCGGTYYARRHEGETAAQAVARFRKANPHVRPHNNVVAVTWMEKPADAGT